MESVSCPECSCRVPRSPDLLERHLKTDFKYYPFSCAICGLSFPSHEQAKVHFTRRSSPHYMQPPQLVEAADADIEERIYQILQSLCPATPSTSAAISPHVSTPSSTSSSASSRTSTTPSLSTLPPTLSTPSPLPSKASKIPKEEPKATPKKSARKPPQPPAAVDQPTPPKKPRLAPRSQVTSLVARIMQNRRQRVETPAATEKPAPPPATPPPPPAPSPTPVPKAKETSPPDAPEAPPPEEEEEDSDSFEEDEEEEEKEEDESELASDAEESKEFEVAEEPVEGTEGEKEGSADSESSGEDESEDEEAEVEEEDELSAVKTETNEDDSVLNSPRAPPSVNKEERDDRLSCQITGCGQKIIDKFAVFHVSNMHIQFNTFRCRKCEFGTRGWMNKKIRGHAVKAHPGVDPYECVEDLRASVRAQVRTVASLAFPGLNLPELRSKGEDEEPPTSNPASAPVLLPYKREEEAEEGEGEEETASSGGTKAPGLANCRLCHKDISNRYFRNHVTMHHLGPEAFCFSCTLCGQKSRDITNGSGNIRKHMESKHGTKGVLGENIVDNRAALKPLIDSTVSTCFSSSFN